MTYKRFVMLSLFPLGLFTVANFIVWKFCTEDLLTKKSDGGELARMSYRLDSKLYRKNKIDLPRRHIIFKDYKNKKIDLLTLGDSFSLGFGEGYNYFYQDYIASFNNFTVLNLHPYPTDSAIMGAEPLTNLIALFNNGLLEEIRPRYILIQSAERYCIQRFSRHHDFRLTVPREKLLNFYNNSSYNFDYLPPVGFVNAGNYKFFYYKLLYLFSDRAFNNGPFAVVARKLKLPLFSAKDDRTLLFLNQDLLNIGLATPLTVINLNENLNTMARLLAKKGIKLYFMPVVDKSNLYRDYLQDNPYPESTFFETLRTLPKNYKFIDTKQILSEELRQGGLDLFYPDDSHWSWKASQKIFESVRFP